MIESFLAETPEIKYIFLIFALFVIPKLLLRFRIPAGITAFLLGIFSTTYLQWFQNDATVNLLSTLGIITLFLFAGLEIHMKELAAAKNVLLKYVAVRLIAILCFVAASVYLFELEIHVAFIFALALLTPSTGFIFDSITNLPLSKDEKYWIKLKAIAMEIFGIAIMFIAMNATSLKGFGTSSFILLVMIFLLPVTFRVFARLTTRYAPQTEFAFLLIVAICCGFITRKLGVYYLVGAFVVGVVAQRFRELTPSSASKGMIHSVKLFSSFFMPFYFFHAGQGIESSDFTWKAVFFGLALVVIVTPIRVALTIGVRKKALGESANESFSIAVSLLPTLVFGLVLADILKNVFNVPHYLFGGVIIYTVLASLIPAFFFKNIPIDEVPEPSFLEVERL